jgi:hypothetical protein
MTVDELIDAGPGESSRGVSKSEVGSLTGVASVEVPMVVLEPVSPSEVRRRLCDAIALQSEDPILAGESVFRILVDTDLSPRQLAALGATRSRPTLENLVFLARLPREIHCMVRDCSLATGKAELIGRYLVDAPEDLKIRAARSAVSHRLSSAEVKRMGRIYRASRDFRFPE